MDHRWRSRHTASIQWFPLWHCPLLLVYEALNADVFSYFVRFAYITDFFLFSFNLESQIVTHNGRALCKSVSIRVREEWFRDTNTNNFRLASLRSWGFMRWQTNRHTASLFQRRRQCSDRNTSRTLDASRSNWYRKRKVIDNTIASMKRIIQIGVQQN